MLRVNTPRLSGFWYCAATLSLVWACSGDGKGPAATGSGGLDAGAGESGLAGNAGNAAATAGSATMVGGAPAGGEPGSGGAGMGGAAGAGGEPAEPDCVEPSDCVVPETKPVGCAEAQCTDGKCTFSARDADGDTFLAKRCESLDASIEVVTGDDCDDTDKAVNPEGWDGPAVDGHANGCNDQIDQDCSGIVDDQVGANQATCTCTPNDTEPCGSTASGLPIDYPIIDEVTHKPVGECKLGSRECLPNGTWGACTNAVGPIAEVCDNKNNDCDANTDEDPTNPKQIYCDADKDNHIAATSVHQVACAPSGACAGEWRSFDAVPTLDDCDDADPKNFAGPTTLETCDGQDNNCDGIVDGKLATDDLKFTYYQDVDGDKYGNDASETKACKPPGAGWVDSEHGGDCADVTVADKAIHPNADEVCNNKDDNCDGVVDNGKASDSCEVTGNAATMACENPPGAPNANECVVKTCSGKYLDCNGGTDCEIDGNTDEDHCGSCATSCNLVCQAGACDELVGVAGGTSFTCGRKSSGRLVCWGANESGQLGDASNTPHSAPGAVATLTAATALDAGSAHACAIQAGAVYCWGDNSSKQIGLGLAQASKSDPNLVGSFSNATRVAAGGSHSCAIHSSGALSCWGSRELGQLGHGAVVVGGIASPQATVDGNGLPLSKAIAVTAGLEHSCAIIGATAQATQGKVVCWGSNGKGQLGDGVADHAIAKCTEIGGVDCSHHAVDVTGLTDATALAAGHYFSCAVRAGGSVVCWGQNNWGQLGNNSTVGSSTPVTVSGLAQVSALAADGYNVCAVSAGTVKCWGSNDSGQLGDNTTHATCGTQDCAKVPATTSLTGVGAVGVGELHGCALLTVGGKGYCWGQGDDGRLGTGNATDQALPKAIVRQL